MNKAIIKFIYLFLGVMLILYVIYARFLVIRIPKNLIMFQPPNMKIILLVITSIIITTIILVKSITVLLNIKPSQGFLHNMLLYINNIIEESLTTVYAAILNMIKNGYSKISSFSRIFYDTFKNITEGIFIYISLSIRAIILVIFSIDVFYSFKLNYFYKALILLCIPLSINIIIFILKDFAKNLENAEYYLELAGVSEQGDPLFKPSTGNEDIDLNYHIEQFRLCSQIHGYLEVYNYLYSYYTPRYNLFAYSFYLFSWCYVLFVNLLYM